MKKLVMLCVLSFIFTAAYSQVQLGATAGLNLSTFGGDGTGNKLKLGVHAGAFASLEIRDKIGLRPEVLFSTQGSSFESGKTNFTNINIPIFLTYVFAENLTAMLGPQFGFLVAAKDVVDGSGTFDAKDRHTSGDIAMAIGILYTYQVVMHAFVRYVAGITNLNATASDFRLTHSVIQLGIAYTLVGN